MVVQVPVLGRVADVGRVQQQRQGFGFVNTAKREDNQRSSSFGFFWLFCPVIIIIGNANLFF